MSAQRWLYLRQLLGTGRTRPVPSFQKEVVVLALYRMSVPGTGALVALLTCFAYAGIAEAKPITVTMKSLSYEPKTVEIHIGRYHRMDQRLVDKAHSHLR
jgi:hypothetical protein